MSADNGTIKESFAYDTRNRLTSASTQVGGKTYATGWTYDKNGNVTAITYASGKQVSHTYDAAGRLSSVQDWAGHTWSFTHDGAGKLLLMTAPGNVSATQSYDAAFSGAALVPGLGIGATVAKWGKNVAKVVKTADKVSDVTVTIGKTTMKGDVYLGDLIEGIENKTIMYREVFGNTAKEGYQRLPVKPDGYYHVYDVDLKPLGAINKGPQRFVRGNGGELYYTPDHYHTFISLN